MATAPSSHVARQEAAPAVPHRSSASADADFVRHMKRVLLIAIPVLVALWIGLIALAVTFSDVGYAAPIAMGAGVGVLAGLFWAAWYGFVAFARNEEAERRSSLSSQSQ